MSVVAVMRTLMRGDADLPMPPYKTGPPLWGPAIGEVISAPGTGLSPGDLVTHNHGWREYAAVDAAEAQLSTLRRCPMWPPTSHKD
ncbi:MULTISPECIES: hypothetical protein [Nonomuraea]|uniref:Oxidoreductase N-terminal domain-containing protein n=1 Tax=Nonomuraea mangrovi TaxID=2316207 RepID=A0ABW4SNP1_9ACTN